jgi:hypothetical protein
MPTSAIPIVTLRRQAREAPWAVGELAALADRLLSAAGHAPERPTTDRTVRFYVSRAVVQAPFGRGPGTAWGYPHLVELLAARLAQQQGDSLDAIALRRGQLTPTALEEWTARALGAALPELAPAPRHDPPLGEAWSRHAVAPGVELHLADDHPLRRDTARLGALLDHLRREVVPSPEETG